MAAGASTASALLTANFETDRLMLVIDTTNFTDQTSFNGSARPCTSSND
jgi:hypothetical protein